MVFARRKAGEVDRPAFLEFSEKAFATKVLDNRNAPVYRARDTILIDPDEPALDGEDCVFTADPGAESGAPAVIGCLVSSTPTAWIAKQYAAKEQRELPKATFPNCWPIVGRYRRR